MSPHITIVILSTHLLQTLLQVVDAIPTIGTQLKIIAAVKATRQGGDGMLGIIITLFNMDMHMFTHMILQQG